MKKTFLLLLVFLFGYNLNLFSQTYTMPAEEQQHEGTWLQWPHQYEYGNSYRDSLEPIWVAMTQALVQSENVHIIAYNSATQTRITTLLTNAGVSLTNINFKIFQTNDVWVRDNGPIYVRDGSGNLSIEDWGFNGWGGKYNYNLDNPIPNEIATATSTPVVNLNSTMTVEGGAYELDGNGVLMACRSSIIAQTPASSVRNPGMTQAQAEAILSPNLGISKFIWLNGVTGVDLTDMHIDGFVHFANDSTLVTMDTADLVYWEVPQADIDTLYNAKNINNHPYHFVFVPLTQNNVSTTNGTNLGYEGSYCNYYVANTVVLVPNYSDPNDVTANNIIQQLYPTRTVIGIDVRDLYQYGGMVHCVTQQQPVAVATGLNIHPDQEFNVDQNYPNPFSDKTTIDLTLKNNSDVVVSIYNSFGQLVTTPVNSSLPAGKHSIEINAGNFANGIYSCMVSVNHQPPVCRKMIVVK